MMMPLFPTSRVPAPPVFGVCASSIVFAATVKLSLTKVVWAAAGNAAASATAQQTAGARRRSIGYFGDTTRPHADHFHAWTAAAAPAEDPLLQRVLMQSMYEH